MELRLALLAGMADDAELWKGNFLCNIEFYLVEILVLDMFVEMGGFLC